MNTGYLSNVLGTRDERACDWGCSLSAGSFRAYCTRTYVMFRIYKVYMNHICLFIDIPVKIDDLFAVQSVCVYVRCILSRNVSHTHMHTWSYYSLVSADVYGGDDGDED